MGGEIISPQIIFTGEQMLIPIKRHVLISGETWEILINTNYIIKIEPTGEEIQTRIIIDSRTPDEGVIVMYTKESISSIRAKITKMRNKCTTET